MAKLQLLKLQKTSPGLQREAEGGAEEKINTSLFSHIKTLVFVRWGSNLLNFQA